MDLKKTGIITVLLLSIFACNFATPAATSTPTLEIPNSQPTIAVPTNQTNSCNWTNSRKLPHVPRGQLLEHAR